MLRSLAAIGAAVAVVFLLIPRPDTRVVQPVEVDVAAAGFQDTAMFELVVPAVPDGWTPTSVRFRPDSADAVPTWHIGYLTDDERYAALEVAADATSRWIEEQTGNGESAEQVDVAGRAWQVLRSGDPVRTHLLLEDDPGAGGAVTTTVVTGSASLDDLAVLAEATLAARS